MGRMMRNGKNMGRKFSQQFLCGGLNILLGYVVVTAPLGSVVVVTPLGSVVVVVVTEAAGAGGASCATAKTDKARMAMSAMEERSFFMVRQG